MAKQPSLPFQPWSYSKPSGFDNRNETRYRATACSLKKLYSAFCRSVIATVRRVVEPRTYGFSFKARSSQQKATQNYGHCDAAQPNQKHDFAAACKCCKVHS